MRISDWSSDVCSSDLAPPPPRRSGRRTTGWPGTGWPSGPATRRRCRPSWRITRPASMASPEKQTGKGEMALSQTDEVETNQDKRSYVRAEDARTFGKRLLLAAGLPEAAAVIVADDRKITRLNSRHYCASR